ncbi:MAG: hypothetical protein RMM08_07140 [Armatimonadota bacterium]|nr:hypothetical protein [bacterium]MDW8321120.1 hypothetical protein [Armatimonadota bacterium]
MNTRCKYLRTKMDYVAHATVTQDDLDMAVRSSQRHFWCLRTMKPLGPDDMPVDDTSCVRERECFVAEGEA